MTSVTIPVTVLTGFLGSGKTTVINQLMKRSELADTMVIVNELGEIPLDHLLIERTDENIALLRSGCLCCAVRGDLIETLRDLAVQRSAGTIARFPRVIIETTGLADPAPILHTLMVEPDVTRDYRLEGVITAVDAVNGLGSLDHHDEALKQAAMADRLLLTKSDLASVHAVEAVKARLNQFNRHAPIIAVLNGDVEPADIFSSGPYDPATKTESVRQWLRDELEPHRHGSEREAEHANGHDHHRHDLLVRTHSIVVDTPLDWAAFSNWLDLMSAMRGEQMLRLKGIVAIREHPDQPVVIHGVQHVIHPVVKLDRWPSDDRRTRIVLIARDLPPELVENTLMKFGQVAREQILVT